MRLLSLVFIALFSINTFADEIKCYSNNKIVYQSKQVKDVVESDDGWFITEINTNLKVFLPFDCIVKFYD